MLLSDYKQKMLEIFSGDKFEILPSDPLEQNIKEFRKCIENIKPYLNPKTFLKIMPLEGNKRAYGIIKRHRPGHPCRPITSGIGSLTKGAEDYLYNILSPLESECKFLIKSTRQFKKIFNENSSKFDPTKHNVVSYDADSLFTNVNSSMVIEHVLAQIYKKSKQTFRRR